MTKDVYTELWTDIRECVLDVSQDNQSTDKVVDDIMELFDITVVEPVEATKKSSKHNFHGRHTGVL